MSYSKKYLDDLTYDIIGAAIEVHKHIGPGLLENVYHQCLAKEFDIREIGYSSEKLIEVKYKGIGIDTKLRYDFLVENAIIVELKSVSEFIPIFEAQLITYMKILDKPKGILINFNVNNIFDEGQKTIVSEMFWNLP